MIVVYRALDRVRRTDRRPRLPVMAQALAALLSRRPQEASSRGDLVPVLNRIWKRRGEAIWSVSDLRHDGLVEPGDTHQLGRELSKAWRRGLPVGPFDLVRLDADDRAGRLWRLSRV